MKEIDALLAKYASHLMEKEKVLSAIELYPHAKHCVSCLPYVRSYVVHGLCLSKVCTLVLQLGNGLIMNKIVLTD